MDRKHARQKSRRALPAFAAKILSLAATVPPRVQSKDEESNMTNLIIACARSAGTIATASFKTQTDRERVLTLIGKRLDEMGYRLDTAGGLKSRHIEARVKRWGEEQLSSGSIKNRMSALRWLAAKINKQNIVARANDAYGIADRRHASDW